MTVKINYLQKRLNKNDSNIVLFIDNKFKTNNLKKFLSDSEYNYINDLLKNIDLKKKIFF